MLIEIPSPPRTIMEVYKMLPEGTLAELINGHIYMSPAPSNKHQRVLKKFLKLVDDFIIKNDLGELFVSPIDIFFDRHSNAVQPDLAFISKENPNQPMDFEPFHGSPDILVEFLSPSNEKHDRFVKKDLYEKFGVKEYWIIDPDTKESFVYQLVENKYALSKRDNSQLFSPFFNHSFTI
jgi:Uma2 family endonuclease